MNDSTNPAESQLGNGANPAPRPISPSHREELAKSGITADVACEAGIYSEFDPRKVSALLGWKGAAKQLGTCLVFPFFNPDGTATGYARLKPRTPRKGKDGKARKYEAPAGVASRAYFPPRTRPVLDDTGASLIITEGEKKALCADANGFPCIGISGVWNWTFKPKDTGTQPKILSGDPPEKPLIPDLDQRQWSGRVVYIAFDSDKADNPSVMAAQRMLAAKLEGRGAVVRIIDIPSADDGSKQGIDDFIVANDRDAFQGLVDSATDAGEYADAHPEPIRSIADPHSLADGYIRHLDPDIVFPHLRYWQGGYWRYTGTHYQQSPTDDVKACVNRWTRCELDQRIEGIMRRTGDAKPVNVTAKLTGDVMLALNGQCGLSSDTVMPSWLGCSEFGDPADIIPARNGLLNVRTGKLIPHSPRFFGSYCVPYNYDPFAPTPCEWLRFLQSVWPRDPESIATLQEWLGYLLTADTSQQKILFLLGPKRSGKGTICRVLSDLIGEDNVAGPTLASLSTNFGLQPLIGKPVATISDARLSGRESSGIITERLLSISGEDTLTVDKKHREPITARLPTRFVIASNELPRLNDASGALVSRFIILRFTESYFGKEDTGLGSRLKLELPGILIWSLGGLRRLRNRGHFVQPASGRELIECMEELSSPIRQFVKDRCIVGKGERVPIPELYRAWELWCTDTGRDHPGTHQTFGRDLRAAVPGIADGEHKVQFPDGTRLRVYVGIRLRRPDDPDSFDNMPSPPELPPDIPGFGGDDTDHPGHLFDPDTDISAIKG